MRQLRCTLLLSLPILVVAALTAAAGAADRPTATPEQLERLRAQIQDLQTRIERTRGERDNERAALRRVEKSIAKTSSILRRIRGELIEQRSQLERLEEERALVQARLGTQRDAMARQVRAAYMTGQQEYLKLLLNQEDPAAVARVMAYYRFLAEERTRQINTTRAALQRLSDLAAEITKHERELQDLESSQLINRETLEQDRTARADLLARLEREVLNQDQRITALRSDEERLAKLLEGLSLVVEELHTQAGPAARFAAARGRLPLPVRARVVAHFGTPKEGGPLTWDGVFLQAPRGAEITAVFPGRVAFAGWFGGLGQLLILDHGDGYMSLYGHNEQLLVDVGDWVGQDQAIATTGDSGGLNNPGLYFEIRHKGQPRDPLLWCRNS